jgi:hypothetical protein
MPRTSVGAEPAQHAGEKVGLSLGIVERVVGVGSRTEQIGRHVVLRCVA